MAQRICQVLHKTKCHSVFLPITCDGHFSGSRKYWPFTEKFKCSFLLSKVTPNAPHDDTRSTHRSASKRREDKIWFDKIDNIEHKISWSSLGRIHFSGKYGKDTVRPCVIFFRTLVLKRFLSGTLTDDNTWVTIYCDHSLFCHRCIKCLQPLPAQSVWDKNITEVVYTGFVCSYTVLTKFYQNTKSSDKLIKH